MIIEAANIADATRSTQQAQITNEWFYREPRISLSSWSGQDENFPLSPLFASPIGMHLSQNFIECLPILNSAEAVPRGKSWSHGTRNPLPARHRSVWVMNLRWELRYLWGSQRCEAHAAYAKGRRAGKEKQDCTSSQQLAIRLILLDLNWQKGTLLVSISAT